MTQTEIIKQEVDANNGIITTKHITDMGISKPVFYQFVKDTGMEMIGRGIYATDEAWIDDAYILEVSSPGLGRQLKKDRHFENSIGEEVELKLFEATDAGKEFEGVLKSFDKDSITVTIGDEDKKFERSALALVKLKLDF